MDYSILHQHLKKISELIQKIDENKGKEILEIPEDAESTLEKLQSGVDMLEKMTNTLLNQEKIKQEDIEKILSEPFDKYPLAYQNLMKTIQDLKQQAERQHREYLLAIESARLHDKKTGNMADPKAAARKRKKRFDRLGGQGMIPL